MKTAHKWGLCGSVMSITSVVHRLTDLCPVFQLLQIERLAEDDWTSKKIMPVSFATLLDDNDDDDADKETDLRKCSICAYVAVH